MEARSANFLRGGSKFGFISRYPLGIERSNRDFGPKIALLGHPDTTFGSRTQPSRGYHSVVCMGALGTQVRGDCEIWRPEVPIFFRH